MSRDEKHKTVNALNGRRQFRSPVPSPPPHGLVCAVRHLLSDRRTPRGFDMIIATIIIACRINGAALWGREKNPDPGEPVYHRGLHAPSRSQKSAQTTYLETSVFVRDPSTCGRIRPLTSVGNLTVFTLRSVECYRLFGATFRLPVCAGTSWIVRRTYETRWHFVTARPPYRTTSVKLKFLCFSFLSLTDEKSKTFTAYPIIIGPNFFFFFFYPFLACTPVNFYSLDTWSRNNGKN